LIYIGLLTILAVLQVAFVFAVRHGLQEDNQRPLQFFGVMTAILIFCGLFPQYYEIWKLNEVVGISIIFMAVDLLGGLFSALSLVFKPSFDPLLGFSYIGVVVLALPSLGRVSADVSPAGVRRWGHTPQLHTQSSRAEAQRTDNSS